MFFFRFRLLETCAGHVSFSRNRLPQARRPPREMIHITETANLRKIRFFFSVAQLATKKSRYFFRISPEIAGSVPALMAWRTTYRWSSDSAKHSVRPMTMRGCLSLHFFIWFPLTPHLLIRDSSCTACFNLGFQLYCTSFGLCFFFLSPGI